MKKTFEEALQDLLAEYSDLEGSDEIISALELALYAQREIGQ